MERRDEIFHDVIRELHALFDIAEQDIKLESRLYEDLDLDSIDAVDLVVRLQEITKKRIQPDQFKSVRTVEDVVDAVEELVDSAA
ncbi:MAG: acyl carrier protein [Gammaproteobacteria bacterium]|nr:acyl carrier protein [Gammaproteobacteria bacterium]MDH3433499.1 acyl carrier protein [Gammaproteobacteria bacterium]